MNKSQKVTKKVDFRKITIKDIEGKSVEVDFSKQIGNQLYMQGQNIEECELGQDIYHKGEVEMTDKDIEAVKRFVGNYPYLSRTAIEDVMK